MVALRQGKRKKCVCFGQGGLRLHLNHPNQILLSQAMPVHHSLPEPISFDRPRSWIFLDLLPRPLCPLLHIRTSLAAQERSPGRSSYTVFQEIWLSLDGLALLGFLLFHP